MGGPEKAPHLFTHHDAHPAVIHELLDKSFGVEWLVWDPYALWDEITREFRTSISELSRTKIQALRCLHSTKGFWEDWDVFSPTVQALNNRIPSFAIVQKPTTAQIFVAVDIASIIRKNEYSKEVQRYIAASLLDEGIYHTVSPLEFVQDELNDAHRFCRNCGQLGIDKEEVWCYNCGSSDLVTEDVTLPKSDQLRIDDILNDKYDIIEESAIDILGAKLKVAHNYIMLRRAQMEKQMRLL